MKNIFDQSTRNEVIARINSLNNTSSAQWGKMNLFQMLRHCILWDDMVLQNKRYKRAFIGILLGKILLKMELQDRPMRQNNPTIPELIIKETNGDIEAEKLRWISSVNKYAQYSLPDFSFVHPYFGKMTREQIGLHAYKHCDHHLRQFGC